MKQLRFAQITQIISQLLLTTGLFFLMGLGCLLMASPGEAVAGDSDPLARLRQGVVRIKLENGLRVLIYPRREVPIFAGQVWIKVGGVDELAGATGISHLLEHMAFKGTRTIGTKNFARESELLDEIEKLAAVDSRGILKNQRYQEINEELNSIGNDNEFSRLYQQRGAVGLNAGTSKDYTMYEVSVPSSAFEFWCWMESDRLLNPVFRQFYKEREVVLEERRMRTDDDPSGRVYEALLATAFWAHPNRQPVIGWKSDVESLTATQIADLHRAYYRADNMVVALVGDIDPVAARPVLERYFGRLPRPNTPLPQVTVVEPPQEGERVTQVYFDAEPSFTIGYHKPVYPNLDDLYFSVLHEILSGSRSSLMERELVQHRQLATSVFTTEAPGERYPSLFVVGATPRSGVTNSQLRDELQRMFDNLKEKPLSAEVLGAAKRRLETSLISGLAQNEGLVEALARNELLHGDWEIFLKMYDTIRSTTPEDIMRLARSYLNVANRTYVEIRPKGRA